MGEFRERGSMKRNDETPVLEIFSDFI